MKAVDFFCGGGLASNGLHQAGITPILGIDNKPWCFWSYWSNFNNEPALCDLTDLNMTSELLSKRGIAPSFDGVFWVSAPCQGFSSANSNRHSSDPRNAIMLSIIPFLSEKFQRATLIVENVSSLMNSNYSSLRALLYQSIYKTRSFNMSDKLLSSSIHCASDFGIAQNRKRIVFSIPPKGGTLRAFKHDNKSQSSISSAICNLNDSDLESFPLTPNEKRIFAGIPAGGNWRSSKESREFAHKIFGDEIVPNDYLRRPSFEGLAPCLLASPQMRFKSMCPIHPTELRRFTIGELKALQGTPQSHELIGRIHEKHSMVGNGVPPPMAKAAAEFFVK